jgi:hypothetical protein
MISISSSPRAVLGLLLSVVLLLAGNFVPGSGSGQYGGGSGIQGAEASRTLLASRDDNEEHI